ncbi:MAG: aldo/keto reductase [Spirochaetales bacterium]|nr:aldo/keto reductase [Spirochaetales bacterium]
MISLFNNSKDNESKIVYGCMGGAGAFGKQDELDSIDALKTAYKVGIRFFDTAEMYGDGYSEQLLSRSLNDVRKDIRISSKVSPHNMSYKGIIEACERSLNNLDTDYIDLYLLHWPNREIPLDESFEALKQLQKEGKILKYGVSNFGKKDLEDALKLGEVSANQVAYHLLFRAVEHEVIPLCKSSSVPLMCYSSLMQGLLTGKYKTLSDFPENRARIRLFDSRKWPQCRHGEFGQEEKGEMALNMLHKIAEGSGIPMAKLAIGWLKAQNAVGGVLVGTRNGEQSHKLTELMDINLSDDLLDALDDATDALKIALGNNIDMWDHRTR